MGSGGEATRRRRGLLLVVLAASAALAGVLIAADGEDGESGERADRPRAGAADRATPAAETAPTVADFHGAVPILMYHAISPAPADAALPDLFVPQAEFEEQMKWLSEQGYHGVTLGQVFAAWERGEPIAENPVVISFDDGLQSQFVGARPMLERLGWPAVLNLAIGHLDSGDLSAAQVKELTDSGWELGSHTFTHPDLTQPGVDLSREIADSRTYLEKRFGVPVDFFCYPAGAYDDAVRAAVEAAGYLGATTTNDGLAEPGSPFELSRIRVEPGEGSAGLRARLGAPGASTPPA